ncbi:MAG: GNAT family N-acetyltransferase [Pseudomonadota bacterium]
MSVARHLTTDRLILRQPETRDLAAYTAYCASDRSRFVRGPFSEAEAFDTFAAIIGHWTLRGFGRYVMEREGRAIGHVGPLALPAAEAPEFTWTLWDGAAEGQGFATEGALAVKAHLLGDLGWPQMMIRIQPDNTASCRIAERIGAVLTGAPAPAWYPGALTYQLMAEVTA